LREIVPCRVKVLNTSSRPSLELLHLIEKPVRALKAARCMSWSLTSTLNALPRCANIYISRDRPYNLHTIHTALECCCLDLRGQSVALVEHSYSLYLEMGSVQIFDRNTLTRNSAPTLFPHLQGDAHLMKRSYRRDR
jgi:hypothetical protein